MRRPITDSATSNQTMPVYADSTSANRQPAGRMFWLTWNKFLGSYSALTRVNRS